MQNLIVSIAVFFVLAIVGIAASYLVYKLVDKTRWYAPYEEPLLAAIGIIRQGGCVSHEENPADGLSDGEVVTSADGRELGIVEETESGTSVLAKDHSVFPDDRKWYRTGIRIDDITWSALWGAIESDENTQRTKRATKAH